MLYNKHFRKIEHSIARWGGNGVIKVHIIKDVPRTWKITVQYDKPIKIAQAWGDGHKSWQNSGGKLIQVLKKCSTIQSILQINEN